MGASGAGLTYQFFLEGPVYSDFLTEQDALVDSVQCRLSMSGFYNGIKKAFE